MDLFDVTHGVSQIDKARDATTTERNAYLRWLADHRGIDIAGCSYANDGVWRGAGEDRVCVLPMPGYGAQPVATLDVVDDAGRVIRSTPLATDSRGRLALSARQIADATGLKPARKPRAAGKRVQSSAADQSPIGRAAPATDPAPIAASPAPAMDTELAERVAALEATLVRMGVAIAEPQAARPRRTEAHRRAIQRAWDMRRLMRERADLDRRALLVANGDNQQLLERLHKAEAERDTLAEATADALASLGDKSQQLAAVTDRAAAAIRDADALRLQLADAESAWIAAQAEADRYAPLVAAVHALAPPNSTSAPVLVVSNDRRNMRKAA
jgi:hypothetical protein